MDRSKPVSRKSLRKAAIVKRAWTNAMICARPLWLGTKQTDRNHMANFGGWLDATLIRGA
jgi:hypothetical protein